MIRAELMDLDLVQMLERDDLNVEENRWVRTQAAQMIRDARLVADRLETTVLQLQSIQLCMPQA